MESKILKALLILNFIILGCSILFIHDNEHIYWGFMLLSWFIIYQYNRLSNLYIKIKLDELKKINDDFIASLK